MKEPDLVTRVLEALDGRPFGAKEIATTRLCNAAPDLLAALEAMQDGYLGTKEQFDAAWEQASAAIRKAKGDE